MDGLPEKGWFNPLATFEAEPTEDAAAAEAMQNEQDELNQALLSMTRSRNGRKVLAWLAKVSEPASFDPALGFYNGSAYGFFREGQNSVVREIRTRIQRAQEG